MAGFPAKESTSTCNCPISRCNSSMVFYGSAAFLLPCSKSLAARFTSSCFQTLIITRYTPYSEDSSARVFSPDSAAIATRA